MFDLRCFDLIEAVNQAGFSFIHIYFNIKGLIQALASSQIELLFSCSCSDCCFLDIVHGKLIGVSVPKFRLWFRKKNGFNIFPFKHVINAIMN